ncbi:MAG: ABC transporter ATP-binding protein [Thermoguttaceae bacterium]|jgi:subfamily B ATP-binding cassette protein MsbA
MYNYWRAIKLTFKYKWNIIGVVLASIFLALCWGGNIATVYPLVQVSFQGDSVNSWLAKEIQNQSERLSRLYAEENAIANGVDPDDKDAILEAISREKSAPRPDDNTSKENSSDSIEERRRVDLDDPTLSPRAQQRLSVLDVQIANAEKLLMRYKQFQPYIARWTPDDPFLTVVMLMVYVAVLTTIKGVCTYVHTYLSTRLGQLGSLELRSLFFRKMLYYETTFFSQRGITDATTRFTSDMGTLTNGITLAYGRALREPLKLIVCLIGALLVSWQLLLFTFLFVPIAVVLIRWLAKSLKRVVRRMMAEMAQLYGRIDETFRAIRVVKSFNREDYETAKFASANETYFKRGMKTAKYDALTSPLTELLGIGMLVLAITAGAYLIIYQETSLFGIPTSSRPFDLGRLILFYGFLIGASDPARRLSDIFTNIQGACAAADRVYEVIDRDVLIKDCASPRRLTEFKDSIVFDNVYYEYPVEVAKSQETRHNKKVRIEDVVKDSVRRRCRGLSAKFKGRPGDSNAPPPSANNDAVPAPDVQASESRVVLRGVSLSIKRGETIAIVGRSGCGKSTLMSMIPRFIDPIKGRVLIDGIPVTELKTSDLRDQIGLVSQDSVLFNDTVLENIRYGRLDATREEIIQAAKDAYADEFICNELADGYETIVGPGGGALSGGQRQRIALARALLKNPQIFLLDEATSQIDLQSERFIHQALKKFVGGRTTILVTHRLTAIQLADRVVVMQEGVPQFIGTHEETLKHSPFYASLWASESAGSDSELE